MKLHNYDFPLSNRRKREVTMDVSEDGAVVLVCFTFDSLRVWGLGVL